MKVVKVLVLLSAMSSFPAGAWDVLPTLSAFFVGGVAGFGGHWFASHNSPEQQCLTHVTQLQDIIADQSLVAKGADCIGEPGVVTTHLARFITNNGITLERYAHDIGNNLERSEKELMKAQTAVKQLDIDEAAKQNLNTLIADARQVVQKRHALYEQVVGDNRPFISLQYHENTRKTRATGPYRCDQSMSFEAIESHVTGMRRDIKDLTKSVEQAEVFCKNRGCTDYQRNLLNSGAREVKNLQEQYKSIVDSRLFATKQAEYEERQKIQKQHDLAMLRIKEQHELDVKKEGLREEIRTLKVQNADLKSKKKDLESQNFALSTLMATVNGENLLLKSEKSNLLQQLSRYQNVKPVHVPAPLLDVERNQLRQDLHEMQHHLVQSPEARALQENPTFNALRMKVQEIIRRMSSGLGS
jgi:hypothetical protein